MPAPDPAQGTGSAQSPRRRELKRGGGGCPQGPLRTLLLAGLLTACDGGVQEIVNPSRLPSFSAQGLHALTDIALGGVRGRIGALGDFDSDMNTDILWISEDQRTVQVLLWDSRLLSFKISPSAQIKLHDRESGTVINVAASDFNKDGKLDVLVVSQAENHVTTSLLLYFGNAKTLTQTPLRLPNAGTTQPIIMEANGDMAPDLFGMAVTGEGDGGGVKGAGYLGPTEDRAFWINQLPVHASCYNGQKDEDETGVDCGGSVCLACACFDNFVDHPSCGFQLKIADAMSTFPRIHPKRGMAFADMNSDCLSDLVIPTVDDKVEIWVNEGALDGSPMFRAPAPSMHVLTLPVGAGGVSVGDFNRDGSQDLLYAVAAGCTASNLFCDTSEIHIAYNSHSDSDRPAEALCTDPGAFTVGVQGTGAAGDFFREGVAVVKKGDAFTEESLIGGTNALVKGVPGVVPNLYADDLGLDPLFVRIGDFDMDGHPDLLFPVRDKDGQTRMRLFISRKSATTPGGRTFSALSCEQDGACDLNDFASLEGAYAGAFFDLMEEGGLDVIVLTRDSGGAMRAFGMLNDVNDGNMFLKGQGLNGVCWEWCTDGVSFPDPKPVGVNQHGIVWKYLTWDLDGSARAHAAVQLSQSSHMALNLPSVVLGLGPASYFIEVVYMGAPLKAARWGQHYMMVQGMIPNSQLVASPTSADPKSWTLHVYVHPSEGVFYVAIVLGCTLLVLAVSILVLQRREKYQDSMEKQLTAHAFI